MINAPSLSLKLDSLSNHLGAIYCPKEKTVRQTMDRQIRCFEGNEHSTLSVSHPRPDCFFERFLSILTFSETSNDLKLKFFPDLIINIDRGTHVDNYVVPKIIDLYAGKNS